MEAPTKKLAPSPYEALLLELTDLDTESLQHMITETLDVSAFLNLAQTNVLFAQLDRTDAVWKIMYKRDFPNEYAFCDNGVLPPFVVLSSKDKILMPPWKRFYIMTRYYYTQVIEEGTFRDAKRFVATAFREKRHVAKLARYFLLRFGKEDYDNHIEDPRYDTIPPKDPAFYFGLSEELQMYWRACFNAYDDIEFADLDIGLNVVPLIETDMTKESYLKLLDGCFLPARKELLPEKLHVAYENYCAHVAHPNIFTYLMCFRPLSGFFYMTYCMHDSRAKKIRALLERDISEFDEEVIAQIARLIDPEGTHQAAVIWDYFLYFRLLFSDVERTIDGKIKFIQSPLSANAASMMRADSSI